MNSKALKCLRTWLVLLCLPSFILASGQSTKLESGNSYYLYNTATGLFISSDTEGQADAPTPLRAHHATLFAVQQTEKGAYTFSHRLGKLGIVITTSYLSSKPISVQATDHANDGTEFEVEGDETGYTLSVKKQWGFFNYVAYLSAAPDAEGEGLSTLQTTTSADDEFARWTLMTESEYEELGHAREEAIERLQEAVNHAKEVQTQISNVPRIVKTSLAATITTAETILSNEAGGAWSWLLPKASIRTINSTAESLYNQTLLYPVLSDYYQACQEAIEKINGISSGAALRALTATATAALEVAATKSAMVTAMTALRAGVVGYLRTLESIAEGQDFTGLVGNYSFETGDSALWYNLGLTGLLGAGNGAKVLENKGDNNVDGCSGKYYAESASLMMQPVLGLPAGEYSLSANFACGTSFTNLQKNVMLNVTTVSQDALLELIQKVLPSAEDFPSILEGITSGSLDLSQLLQNISVGDLFNLLRSAETKSFTLPCKSKTSFASAALTFQVQQDEVAIISMNTGLVPFVNVNEFRVDNVQLTYVANPTGVEKLSTQRTSSDVCYDLSGCRLSSSSAKGLVIKGGKKILKVR